MAAAIIELDALADAVRPAAENDDLLLVRRRGFVDGAAVKRHFVGRIHIGRRRSELGGAGVDALEHRPHAERAASCARPRRPQCPVSLPSRASEKPIALSRRNAWRRSSAGPCRGSRLRCRRCRGSARGTTDRFGRQCESRRRSCRAASPARPSAGRRATACRARRGSRSCRRPRRDPGWRSRRGR